MPCRTHEDEAIAELEMIDDDLAGEATRFANWLHGAC